MNETVYIKINQNVQVDHTDVRLGDVADIYSTDKKIAAKLKTLSVVKIKNEKSEKICVSMMKIVELINSEYPQITVNNLGENDFVIDYICQHKKSKCLQNILITVVCIITFIGSAYGIMAYNNDVSTQEIFERVYEMLGTEPQKQYMIMEISYAIGLAAGIIVFYNHFGNKRFTKEATPIEVEMDKYGKDADTTLINRRDQIGKERK